MKNPLKYGVIGLLASTTLLLTPAAQGQPGGKPPPPAPQQSRESENGPMVSVNFKGGTLEAYIAALQQAAGGKPVNVVVPAAAKRVDLPPIELRDVSTYTALVAVASAFESNSEHEFGVRPMGDATFAIQYARIDRNTTTFSGPARPQAGMNPPAARRLEVYSIRDLIEPPASAGGSPQARVAYESILSAVEAAMSMFDQADPPKLLFHKETGLLLVGGTPYQTEVVDNLIRRIRDDLQRRWSEERGARKQSSEQRRKIAIARTELQIAEKEVAMYEEGVARMTQLVEQGALSKEELSQARLALDRSKATLERRRIEFEAAAETEGAESAQPTGNSLRVYDIADLVASNPETRTLIEHVAENGGGKASIDSQDARGTRIMVDANERTHDTIKTLLDNARKRSK